MPGANPESISCRCLPGWPRETDRETRAQTGFAGNRYPAAMQLHDLPDQRESQSRSLRVGVLNPRHSIKLFKDLRQRVRGNAIALITDFDQQSVAIIARLEHDLSMGRTILDSISNQIGQGL